MAHTMIYASFHVIRDGLLPQIAELSVTRVDARKSDDLGDYQVRFKQGDYEATCRVHSHLRSEPVERLIAKALMRLPKRPCRDGVGGGGVMCRS